MTNEHDINISFGDRVRVRASSVTEERGIAGVTGDVYGETTPSVTNVEVIGDLTDDFALNVQPEQGEAFWIVPDLLEFIDHAPGTEMVVGDAKAVRQEDGSWKESRVSRKEPWWRFW
ncbi:MAG: hypothetical protein V3R99_04160 [Thermoguttaceae bacterium]